MSFHHCIQRAVDAKTITPKRAREAQKFLDDRRQAHASLGPGAEIAALEDTWLKLRRDHQLRKRTNLLQAQKSVEIIDNVTRFVDSDGTQNPAQAIRQLLEWGQSASFQNVASTQAALTAQYRRMIGAMLERHSRNIVGNVRGKAQLRDIVRELHSEGTGSTSARDMAQAVKAAMEQARLDFNAAGGSIGKLDDYGLPHSWDGKVMLQIDADRGVARQKWAADITSKLDWDRIIDLSTGKPFTNSTAAARQDFLTSIFDTITESGWNKREPSGVAVGKATASRRADARVLHFKTADDWMTANDTYGRADPFTTLVAHMDGMARDTAMMRILGPNPQAGLELARQTAAKLANERPWTPSRWLKVKRYSTPQKEVNAAGKQAQRMLDLINGSANTPEMDVVASAFAGYRHVLIASQLGGAMLSAVTDLGFMGMAANHVGMDWNKVLGRHVKALASSGERQLMVRAGIIADSVANVGVAQARLMGDTFGPAVTERLSEFTMRASGLTAWTDIGRGAFRLEFYGLLADNAGRAWDEIDEPLRRLVLEARGFTPADWDDIRTTNLFRDAQDPDASFLIPSDIRNRTDLDPARALDLSLKLEAAVLEQMEFAIPSASLRGRALFQGGAPGSPVGELMKSTLMYKNFAFSLMYNQLGRILHQKVNGSRAANIVMFATVTTVAGAISIQMKEMAKGRDPRDMTTKGFGLAAALQGGGLGIFGDFVYASESRFGGGLASTSAGAVVGAANDAIYLTNDIAHALMDRDQAAYDKLGRNATRFLNRFSGPTNLWYANLALDRMLWDNLQRFVDSDADAAFQRAERKRVKEYGNPSFWAPGAPLPDRAPDFTNIAGEMQP